MKVYVIVYEDDFDLVEIHHIYTDKNKAIEKQKELNETIASPRYAVKEYTVEK